MTPEEELLRDAFLQEMWATVPEQPRAIRDAQRAVDRERRREIEEHAALSSPSVLAPGISPELSTECAERGHSGRSENGAGGRRIAS